VSARRALLSSLPALAGCTWGPMTTMAPKSDFAGWIHTLYLQVLGWDGLILTVVVVAVGLALFRHSARAGDLAEPPQTHPHVGLEVAWTVGPALVLLAIAVPTIRTTFRAQPRTPPPDALRVDVTAHQWWWQIDYPRLHVTTANEIHLPVGRRVWFRLRSGDVIHSFWIPQLGGKRDVVPGHTNTLTLTPEVAGVYLGQCAEFCGLSHANMRLRVFVEPAAAFQAWTRRQQAPPATPGRPAVGTTEVAAGARLFASSPCVTCHAIRGVATQTVGPDLTHFASRTTLAGGTLENTPANLGAWLRDPERLKPGARMPRLPLTDAQVRELVAYLESLT
jgi:cytochrome c oxidase subunit 2